MIVGFRDSFKVNSVLVEGTRQAEGRSREQDGGTKLLSPWLLHPTPKDKPVKVEGEVQHLLSDGTELGGSTNPLPSHQVCTLEAAPPALHLQAWRNEWLFQTSVSLSIKSHGDLPLAAAGREPKGFESFPHLPFLLEAAQNEMPSHFRASWHLPVASKQAGKLLLPGGVLQHLGKWAVGSGRKWRPPMKSAGRRGGENESRLLEDSGLGCVEPPLPPVGRATACVLLVAGGP